MKTRAPKTYWQKYVAELERYLTKQGQVLASRLGAGEFAWWDEERWAVELAHVLGGMAGITSRHAAESSLALLHDDPLSYDFDRTLAYIAQVSSKTARRVNTKTKEIIDKALVAADDTWRDTISTAGRISRLATNEVTQWSAWGVGEAGRQKGVRFKRWVTGANARPEHAAMDGEVVPLDQPFSNGKMHPGGGGEDTGCNCEMRLEVGQ